MGSDYYNGEYSYWTRDANRSTGVRIVNNEGDIVTDYAISSDNALRAVINISKGVIASGDGSKENPYLIK